MVWIDVLNVLASVAALGGVLWVIRVLASLRTRITDAGAFMLELDKHIEALDVVDPATIEEVKRLMGEVEEKIETFWIAR